MRIAGHQKNYMRILGLQKNYLHRPITALCLSIALVTLSVIAIVKGSGTGKIGREDRWYAVTLRHFGVEAEELERSIAIPLEDGIFPLPGLREVRTTIEAGRVRTLVRFQASQRDAYEALRVAVQRVYEALPPSVQRPEIVCSEENRIPLWTAAVVPRSVPEFPGQASLSLGTLLDQTVKPALQRVEGVAEVEVAGTTIREIGVLLDDRLLASRGLSTDQVARSLGSTDRIFPAGYIEEGHRELNILFDGRYPTVEDLKSAWLEVPRGQPLRLGDLGRVTERERKSETLSRLNGKPTVILSVYGNGTVRPKDLSRILGKKITEFQALPLEFQVLSDRGAEEWKAFVSVVLSALQGTGAVALVTLVLIRRMGGSAINALIGALSVPCVVLWSAGLLVFLGFHLDTALLAGLASGVGSAVDASILAVSTLGAVDTTEKGPEALKALVPILLSGGATTMAALVPLVALPSMDSQVQSMAWAVGAVTLTALSASLILLPPLLLLPRPSHHRPPLQNPPRQESTPQKSPRQKCPWNPLRRFEGDFAPLRYLVVQGLRHSNLVLLLSLGIIFGALVFLARAGVDVEGYYSTDSLFIRVEFEGGLHNEAVDRALGEYARALKSRKEVRYVQTEASASSGSVLVSFDPAQLPAGGITAELREEIRSIPLGGAFVYISEPSAQERFWTITVSGEEEGTCKNLAERLTSLCAGLPTVLDGVLNFKEGGDRLLLVPRRERLAASGLWFADVASLVRRAVYGPVAYKRVSETAEVDLRIQGLATENPSMGDLYSLSLPDPRTGGSINLSSVMDRRLVREGGTIRRENRRPVASLTLRTRPLDPRRLKEEVLSLVGQLRLPPSYAVEFDPQAIQEADGAASLGGTFLVALLFCFMVIAGAMESLSAPLLILSAVPPSLGLPAILLTNQGRPLNFTVLCAFVAVSGMAVNAAVLVVEALRSPGYGKNPVEALASQFPLLIATTLTTVAGALPFVFNQTGSDRIVRALAWVTILGVGSSFFFSILWLPALIHRFPRLLYRSKPTTDSAFAEPKGPF